MQTDWRLIAGLGKKGSLEVGFTFHRYGFPYLPGSSLKGLARAYGLLEIAIALEPAIKAKNEKEPLSKLDEILSCEETQKFEEGLKSYNPNSDVLEMARAFRQIFGTTESAGKAIFFDGIPSAKFPPRLELDIMNPHYPDYYKEMGSKEPKTYPANWQSPIPVQFLTVASRSVFRFAIGWRASPQDKEDGSEKNQTTWNGWFKGEQIKQAADEKTPRLLKLARRWLQGGLLELGAGGKTSAGYGYFEDAS
jgi:CRISPR-associated protein Cmr6